MTDGANPTRDVQPVERVLLWIVLAFRVLGYAWLVLLSAAALATDEGADDSIIIAMIVVAGLWTLLTLVLSRSPERLKSPWFVLADGVLAALVANASYFAGAESNLHGGYPISWLAVVAYAYDVRWTMAASLVLFVNQWVGMDIEGSRPLADKLGAVVFPIYGAIVGYGFDLIRQRDSLRRTAEGELREERQRQARYDEQRRLADQLHDSVLQSMHAIQAEPDDPEKVSYIARRQERELRRTIRTLQSEFEEPFVTAMLSARDDVEGLYPVHIDMVCGYDAEMDTRLAVLVEATREAMMNAAKHSGSELVRVHCGESSQHVTVLVRDEGTGFDADNVTPRSIVRRLDGVNGTATFQSTDEFGTEVEMTIPKAT
jgi:signal transduction histidine kinase